MAFRVLGIDDSHWPELVREAEADIFYEPSYCRFITDGTPHRPIMLVYEDDLGKAFDVTVEKAIGSLPFFAEVADQFPRSPFDLASPDYNSPVMLAERGDWEELLKRYRRAVDQYCIELGVITEFVRFHPLSQSAPACAQFLHVQPGAEMVYVDLREGYEHAFQGYRKGHKSTVKKAAREGAGYRFRSSSDAEALAKIYELYMETMLRKQAKSVYHYPFEHFQNLVRQLGDRILLSESLSGDQVASANIFLLGRKQIWFKYSGLDHRFRTSGAHTFMMDRTIHWACERGIDYFMLGAGVEPNDSTHASKRGFSHLSAPVHHFKKIHNQDVLDRLVEAKAKYDRKLGLVTRTAYFPSYWLTESAEKESDGLEHGRTTHTSGLR
jgi:hypothetical protein